jgi:hypothetical protein
MSETENNPAPVANLEEIQQEWHDLTLRVAQLETERGALEQENKKLHTLLEQVIEHRQKSHSELVTLLTTLVSRLPINDIGAVVSRLVEHNNKVTEISASLTNGKIDGNLLQPAILKQLDKVRRELTATVQSAVAELVKTNAPFEAGMLQSLAEQPENYQLPAVTRACRGFIKGQLPRERILREFGDDALIFFRDVTTDAKLNPRPKPEEIMLVFQLDFENLLAKNAEAAGPKRAELQALFQKVRASREFSETARAQKNAFLRLSFALDLLHYYANQSTESPDVVFAQHLPPLVEQLVLTGERDTLDEKLIQQAEGLLAFILSADYRNSVINNIGKSGGLAKTLRFTLAFRAEKLSEMDPITLDCVKHLIPRGTPPTPEALGGILRLMNPHMQVSLIRAIIVTDRIHKEEAEALGRATAKLLGLKEIEKRLDEKSVVAPEREQQQAWDNIRNLVISRTAPAEIVAAIRKRMNGLYDASEVKLCWLALTEIDPMVFVRVFCLLPYLPNGQTDPLARAMMETFATRLIHEKYAATYAKVISALKNMFKVKADSPTLINFIALVKWVNSEAATRLAHDIGLPQH